MRKTLTLFFILIIPYLMCCQLLNLATDLKRTSDAISVYEKVNEKWERESSSKKYFGSGSLSCQMSEIIDPKVNVKSGDILLKCFNGENLFYKSSDKYADEIFFSESGKYILGVSKVSIYRVAFFLIDVEGNLITYTSFTSGYLERTKRADFYCEFSPAYKRLWYDEKNPRVEFIEERGKLKDVLINDCHGDRLSLKKISSIWP